MWPEKVSATSNESLGNANYLNYKRNNIMTMTDFEEMTNIQLKEVCEDFGLEIEAKNPAKPNKKEYLEAIEAFKVKQDATHSDRNAEKEASGRVVKGVDDSKRKPQSQSQLMKLELMRKERVIVRDMQESQTKDEMISVSWGNRMIGRQTEFVDLSGNPQYVRVGAINNLKEAPMTVHEQKSGGGVNMVQKKRFVVVPVEEMSEKELEELANVQKMRNSKLA